MSLPFDILKEIAAVDPVSWSAMLAMPQFARFTLSDKRKYAFSCFGRVETTDKCTTYYLCDKKHRDGDLPAIIYSNGIQKWYQYGEKHRDNDKPAILYADGSAIWYQRGRRHRDGDKPALIRSNGDQFWYQNGLIHRDNDLPAKISGDG